MLSSMYFMNSGLILRSLIQFELTFVQGVKYGSSLNSLIVLSNCPKTIGRKGSLNFISCSQLLWQRSIDHSCGILSVNILFWGLLQILFYCYAVSWCCSLTNLVKLIPKYIMGFDTILDGRDPLISFTSVIICIKECNKFLLIDFICVFLYCGFVFFVYINISSGSLIILH